MDRFTDIQQIGEGTYGIVYKGIMKGSKRTWLSLVADHASSLLCARGAACDPPS